MTDLLSKLADWAEAPEIEGAGLKQFSHRLTKVLAVVALFCVLFCVLLVALPFWLLWVFVSVVAYVPCYLWMGKQPSVSIFDQ